METRIVSNSSKVAMEFTLAASDMEQATVRALNKMADQVKVATSREIRDAGYKLKMAVIKKAISVRKATSGRLRSAVIAKGRSIALIHYGARQTAKGVTVSVLNGRKLIPGAFIAVKKTGEKGVFVRRPNAKHKKVKRGGKTEWHALPIWERYGPSIPDGMMNKKVQAALQALVASKFPAILEHENAWLRRQLGSRAS